MENSINKPPNCLHQEETSSPPISSAPPNYLQFILGNLKHPIA